MAELLYKTLGGVSPRGKARVYFACHPQDHKGYFQEITDEILKISNCAIYFYGEEPELDEDFYLNLGQMQLIVMPVTSRLLYMPNRAMDVEFPYAIEHHIPVLPLMQESGLEQRFNEKCGDLQFLDKHDTDPTAIPYAEKLKKYLEAVLVGDELAAKVRAAFDAYIFLSYRKKDRKFAQELMRLIHRNPLCRDIAIWYDEFLTPGENFNDSIKAALEKSGLFVLAVTPNLVNESNYVMTEEYPMAKEAGKPIVPAQMQPTDPEALRTNYDGIPDSIDPQDEEALLTALRALALRENDGDPQHNFFIGLAYLSGIDVEVDHAYAVKLITGSAEAGLTEAMEKLVSMYETGEGVKRDYMTAISWRERLAEQARVRYEEIASEESAYAYQHQLWCLGDAWYNLQDLTRAKATYERMHHVSHEIAFKYKYRGAISLHGLNASCDKLGNIAKAEMDLRKAREWYEKGLLLREPLAQNETPDVLDDLCVSYIKLGEVAEEDGDLSEAKEWYQKALTVREQMAETGELEALRGLSVCYEKLGNIAYAEGDLPQAKEWYTKGIKLRERLMERGTPEALRDLSTICDKIGDILEEERDLSAAKKWYQRGLDLRKKLAESGTLGAQRGLSASYNRLGDIARAENDLLAAKEWYRKLLDCAVQLAETGTMDSQRNLSLSYIKLGDLARDNGDISEAGEWYRKSIEVRKRLVAIKRTPRNYDDLANAYSKLGMLEMDANLLKKAAEIWEKLVDKCPHTVRYMRSLMLVKFTIEQLQGESDT